MAVHELAILVFVFLIGSCIGCFLNMLIYRLPRGLSLLSRGPACPACGKPIRLLDDIPLLSWLVLRAKCRSCRAPIGTRYFTIELLTGVVFLGVFVCYFKADQVREMPTFSNGGWLIYLVHVTLFGALIASSAIDLEFWIIPLPICWFVTSVAIVGNAGAASALSKQGPVPSLIPMAGPVTGAMALGSMVGVAVSMVLLATGLIRRSYESEVNMESSQGNAQATGPFEDEGHFNHRKEMCHEVLFLGPVIVLTLVAYWVLRSFALAEPWWDRVMATPLIAGALGSVWGYLVGCAMVWLIRILGTLSLGREAMGLGDVHLMGAVGAVIGAKMVAVAFFYGAPFFGLAWSIFVLLSKGDRHIPYGPFLSLGTFTVIILHDFIVQQVNPLFDALRIISPQ